MQFWLSLILIGWDGDVSAFYANHLTKENKLKQRRLDFDTQVKIALSLWFFFSAVTQLAVSNDYFLLPAALVEDVVANKKSLEGLNLNLIKEALINTRQHEAFLSILLVSSSCSIWKFNILLSSWEVCLSKYCVFILAMTEIFHCGKIHLLKDLPHFQHVASAKLMV